MEDSIYKVGDMEGKLTSLDASTYSDVLRRILVSLSNSGFGLSVSMSSLEEVQPTEAIGLVPTETGFDIVVVDLGAPDKGLN